MYSIKNQGGRFLRDDSRINSRTWTDNLLDAKSWDSYNTARREARKYAKATQKAVTLFNQDTDQEWVIE